MFKIHL